MAIVNVTPDSFYDRGLTADPRPRLSGALERVAAGADLLDIGGMTAQPGEPIPVGAEIDRVVPVVRGPARRGSRSPSRSTPTGPRSRPPRWPPAPIS